MNKAIQLNINESEEKNKKISDIYLKIWLNIIEEFRQNRNKPFYGNFYLNSYLGIIDKSDLYILKDMLERNGFTCTTIYTKHFKSPLFVQINRDAVIEYIQNKESNKKCKNNLIKRKIKVTPFSETRKRK